MGIIKLVTSGDYSDNPVGRFDFKTGVFRRIIAGKLERNVAKLNGGKINGYTSIDLSSDIFKVRAAFVYGMQSGENRIFSIADYNTKRAISITHYKSASGDFGIQFWYMDGATAYSMNIGFGTAPTELTDFECEWMVDFKNKKSISLIVNNIERNIQATSTSTNNTAWNNGQTRTICFGEIAHYIDSRSSLGFPYFGQISDENDNILLHFDFLGDNTSEILTDKVSGVTLSKTSEVIISSMPIDITTT